jgi:hypothetical protein
MTQDGELQMTIASIRSAGSTTLPLDTEAEQKADAAAEPDAPQSTLLTAGSTSMASFVPIGGLHPVMQQAAAGSSLVKSASDAAVQGAAEGAGSGGRRHMHDIAFHPLSNSSTNDLH